MFEYYLQDAHKLLSLAEDNYKIDKNEADCKRLLRASIFHTVSAIEAYMNFIAASFSNTDLPEVEIAFLNDEVLVFKKGIKKTRTEYHRIDEKFRVLFYRFYPSYDFQSSDWTTLIQFKKFRDQLIHPKQIDEDMSLSDYKKMAKKGLRSVINIINSLSKKVFKKSLRRTLLDLIPK